MRYGSKGKKKQPKLFRYRNSDAERFLWLTKQKQAETAKKDQRLNKWLEDIDAQMDYAIWKDT